jgi:hypothetical protein
VHVLIIISDNSRTQIYNIIADQTQKKIEINLFDIDRVVAQIFLCFLLSMNEDLFFYIEKLPSIRLAFELETSP